MLAVDPVKAPALPGAAQTRSEFWAIPSARLTTELQTGPGGLTDVEAARRLLVGGANRLTGSPRHERLKLLWAQFRSPISWLLLVAAGLSMVLGERVDAAIILIIILASGLLGYWQERRAHGAVQALLSRIQIKAKVLRSGTRIDIPVREVVAGDVVVLAAGDSIPADPLIIESKDLFVDESALTGESYSAEKRAGTVAADAPLN
jgi:Mg2+-importing ATPase